MHRFRGGVAMLTKLHRLATKRRKSGSKLKTTISDRRSQRTNYSRDRQGRVGTADGSRLETSVNKTLHESATGAKGYTQLKDTEHKSNTKTPEARTDTINWAREVYEIATHSIAATIGIHRQNGANSNQVRNQGKGPTVLGAKYTPRFAKEVRVSRR